MLEMIRFSHTIFALPFAVLAALMAWAAGGAKGSAEADGLASLLAGVRWQQVLGILLCMVTARSAAMAFNRIVDRNIDAANPRTANRHLPSGQLTVAAAATFAIGSSLAFVVSTLLFLPNRLPLYLAIPVLAFLLGYSFTKRFTSLAHFWLGAALMLAPVSAWIAIRGEAVLSNPTDLLPAVVLGLGVMLWVAGFDILYACMDYEFDRQAGLNSVPSRFGIRGALRIAAGCHLLCLAIFAALPLVYPEFGLIYWIGLGLIATLLIYEHILVKPDDLSRVNVAFFQVNAVISIGLLAIGLADIIV